VNTPANKADYGELYGLTRDDRAILRQMVEEFKNRRQNTPSRPNADQAWSEAQDYLSPEVYIAKPDDDIPAATGTDVGLGTGTSIPGTGTATIYQIDPFAESPTINGMGFTRDVFNIAGSVVEAKLCLVLRDKYGRWIIVPAGGGGSGLDLVGGTLVSDHPGRGHVFCIYLGTWNTDGHWDYDYKTHYPAIDWRYGVPYPEVGATGLFIARPYSGSGTGTGMDQGCPETGTASKVIYETVALDCSSPGGPSQ